MILGEFGDGELGGGERSGAADVGLKRRHVAEHANLDVDLLSVRDAADQQERERRQA
jgi:hypothetical protein